MRQLADGSILFSKGEQIPNLPAYAPDPDNPLLYRPAFPDCDYLFFKEKLLPCKKIVALHVCLFNKGAPVSPSFCAGCPVCPKKLPPEVRDGLHTVARNSSNW